MMATTTWSIHMPTYTALPHSPRPSIHWRNSSGSLAKRTMGRPTNQNTARDRRIKRTRVARAAAFFCFWVRVGLLGIVASLRLFQTVFLSIPWITTEI